jgi:hypothetical protein
MMAGALPAVMLRLELDSIATASRAGDTVWPAAGNQVFAAIGGIGGVDYGLLKCGGFGFHKLLIPNPTGIVKYI